MDYSVLREELRKSVYADKTDQQAADLLNALTIPVSRTVLSGAELFEHTAPADLLALSTNNLLIYWGLVAMGSINVDVGTTGRVLLGVLFPAGTTTRTRLQALVAETTLISPSTQIGLSEEVHAHHVATARSM